MRAVGALRQINFSAVFHGEAVAPAQLDEFRQRDSKVFANEFSRRTATRKYEPLGLRQSDPVETRHTVCVYGHQDARVSIPHRLRRW